MGRAPEDEERALDVLAAPGLGGCVVVVEGDVARRGDDLGRVGSKEEGEEEEEEEEEEVEFFFFPLRFSFPSSRRTSHPSPPRSPSGERSFDLSFLRLALH